DCFSTQCACNRVIGQRERFTCRSAHGIGTLGVGQCLSAALNPCVFETHFIEPHDGSLGIMNGYSAGYRFDDRLKPGPFSLERGCQLMCIASCAFKLAGNDTNGETNEQKEKQFNKAL